MKKINPIALMLLVLMFLTGVNYPRALALTEEEIADITKNTWGIFFETDVNDLYPAAIQYTVLDEDPLPLYKANLERLKVNKKGDPEDLVVTLVVAWDSILEKYQEMKLLY